MAYRSGSFKSICRSRFPLVPCITIDDVGHVQLEFNNGIIADIDPSWSRPEGFPTWGGIDLRATGTQGSVDLRAYAQKVTQYNNRKTLYHDYGDFEYLYMMNAFVETIGSQQTELANAQTEWRPPKLWMLPISRQRSMKWSPLHEHLLKGAFFSLFMTF